MSRKGVLFHLKIGMPTYHDKTIQNFLIISLEALLVNFPIYIQFVCYILNGTSECDLQ